MFLCKVMMWMENSENKSRSLESSLIRCVYSLLYGYQIPASMFLHYLQSLAILKSNG